MKKIVNLSLLLLLSFSLFFHLHATWHQSLFGDEIHSLFFFQNHTYQELLTTPVEPIHPNTYYILLKALYSLTPSVLALRLWMFGFFLASTYTVYMISKEILDTRYKIQKTLTSHLLLATNSPLLLPTAYATSAYIWHFSHQLRMYGLSMLTILLSLYFLLKNKKYFSVIFDWLSIMTTYGALIFVISKWISWLTLRFLNRRKDVPVHRGGKFYVSSFLPVTLSLAPIPYVLTNFIIHNPNINESYLYWVHTPVPADFSLGLISFTTGMFLPYFEGYAPLSRNILHPWGDQPLAEMMGNLLNLLIIILGLVLGAWGFKNIKKIITHLTTHNAKRNPLNPGPWALTPLITAYSLLAYLLLFTYSLLTNSHLFHIRQMFSIGVMIILSLPILINVTIKQFNNKIIYLLSYLAIGLIIGINLLGILSDSLPNKQTYPHHFTTIPGTPLIASPTDIELIYKQCGTFDRSKQNEACNKKGIYLNDQDINPEIMKEKFWTTTNAHSQRKTQNAQRTSSCYSISIDYWECQ